MRVSFLVATLFGLVLKGHHKEKPQTCLGGGSPHPLASETHLAGPEQHSAPDTARIPDTLVSPASPGRKKRRPRPHPRDCSIVLRSEGTFPIFSPDVFFLSRLACEREHGNFAGLPF